MLDQRQRADFEELGFVRLPGAFSAADAAAMRAVVWRRLERKYGILERDRSTWTAERPSGFQNTRRHRAFDAIGGVATTEATNDLLGAGCWTRPRTWGQVMVTFPVCRPWVVPHGLWHVDFPYTAPTTGPLVGLKAFVFLADAEPGGGGTLLIAGSHRIVARFVDGPAAELRADTRRTRLCFMTHHPWLRELASANYNADRTARFMDEDGDVDGIPARVVELTGRAGDVVLTHPWTVHHVAYNCGATPRMMRAQSILRKDGDASSPTSSAPRS